jgi:capsular exopolysaccharide synthesis family protein
VTLRAYLRLLREQWLFVFFFVVVLTGVAVLVTYLTPKSYQATAQVLVSSSTTADPSIQAQSNAYVSTQVPTYAKVIGAPEVIKYVQQDLHLGLSDRDVRDKLTAAAETSTSIIDITATDGSASQAASLANSAARGFIQAVEGYSNSVKLFLTGPADQPSSPASPNATLNILLGALLGLLLGAAIAVVRDILDNRIKTPEMLGKTAKAPVMGIIVDDPTTEQHPIATRSGVHNVRAENFRQLRANLQFANIDKHPRVIAVTSSIPEEGKTTVALNLASTFAETGFSVCLVDADLRRPAVADSLGLLGPVGLTSVLIHQIELNEALQQAGPNLWVLASGPTPPNPSEVLASSYVREVIRSLLERFDYVVLDTAPLLPVADGSEVAALADGTLLVARHGLATEPNIEHAVQTLERVDARLVGVIFNRLPSGRSAREYGYSYYSNEVSPGSLAKKNSEPARHARRSLATGARELEKEGSST